MGLYGEMAYGSTAYGDDGDVEEQDRGLLWNVISCELGIPGGRHPLQTTLVGRYLRMMSGRPLPVELQTYLADLVENKLTPRRGRRKSPDISSRNAMIKNLYPLLLREHQSRRVGENSGSPCPGGNNATLEDPPHIAAAKYVIEEIHRQGYPMIDWREVLNIVSSGETT